MSIQIYIILNEPAQNPSNLLIEGQVEKIGHAGNYELAQDSIIKTSSNTWRSVANAVFIVPK